jgi:hypothetical protein
MSEQSPNPSTHNLETIPKNYRAEILLAIEQQAPTPYTEADIEQDEYDADRMRGYNEGLEELLEVVRKVLRAV